jgi:hypothetical protein
MVVDCSPNMVTVAQFILTMLINRVIVSVTPGFFVVKIHSKTLLPIPISPKAMIIFVGICVLYIFKVAFPTFLHSFAKDMIMDMAAHIFILHTTLDFRKL